MSRGQVNDLWKSVIWVSWPCHTGSQLRDLQWYNWTSDRSGLPSAGHSGKSWSYVVRFILENLGRLAPETDLMTLFTFSSMSKLLYYYEWCTSNILHNESMTLNRWIDLQHEWTNVTAQISVIPVCNQLSHTSISLRYSTSVNNKHQCFLPVQIPSHSCWQ